MANGSAPPCLPYRPEIDGLRALAVLAVIAHHLAPQALPGGWLGVDVFFVISGYLIGRLVLQAVDAGRFSLPEFWGRRAKRLLPALLAMLALSALAARALPGAYEREQFWASLASAALSVSNVYFWRHTDYFAPEAAHAPLLHTWSLGVEEQFYLLFPLLALALRRCCGDTRRRLFGLLLLASALLAGLLWHWRPVLAFYLLPARAFELLAGVWLAAAPARSRPAAEGRLCALALMLLLAQGPWAAGSGTQRWLQIGLAVACTATLIARTGGGGGGRVSALLASAPMRLLGRASYSLYLWHLPVLVLGPLLLPQAPRWALLGPALLLGMLSHLGLEQPLRQARWLRPRLALGLGLGLLLAFGAYGGLRQHWHGLPQRPSPDQERLLSAHYDYAKDYELGRCFIGPEMAPRLLQGCPVLPGAAGARRVLLWGDSHAAHLYPGLRRLPHPGLSLTRWAVAGCAPLLGLQSRYRSDCAGVNAELLARVPTLRPQIVVLAADWLAASSLNLAPTVAALRAAGVGRIVVLGPVPRWREPLPYLLAERVSELQRMPTRLSTGLDARLEPLEARLSAQARALGLGYVSALAALCDARGCLVRPDVHSAETSSWDEAHLRPAASERLARALLAALP